MSWGFYIDLDLTLPTATWKQLAKTRTQDHAIAVGWWKLKERDLEERFVDETFDDLRLAKALEFFEGEGALCELHEGAETTILRVCQNLSDDSDLGLAKPIAAIFEGAKAVATGHIQLVNDGSYSGEDGVILRVANGTVTREKIGDCNEVAAVLAAAAFGDLFEIMDDYSPNQPAKAKAKAKSKSKSAKPAASKARPKSTAQPKRKAKPKSRR